MPLSEIVLIIVSLLGIAVLAAAICRRIPVPFTALLVLLGIGLGWLGQHWQPLHILQELRLSPDLVFFVFLPALIFESGYSLDSRQLLKDITPVLMLAVPALLLSTALIGLGLWGILGMQPAHALLFGALISATDPIAVIALFKELGAPLRLNVLVEGESLFNDATALVAFKVILAMVVAGSLQWQDAGSASLEFVWVFVGGAVVGTLFGVALSWLLRFVSSRSAVLTLSIVLAYSCFVVSEHMLHVSGVVAVVAASLCLGIWGRSRMPQQVVESLHDTWEFIAYLCNALLFLLVGLSVDPVWLLHYSDAIVVAILLVLVVRALIIYSMVPLTTRWFSLPRIGMAEQHIMWWGGLKGGLAIAMALSIPVSVEGREVLLALAVGVVVFTLLVNASTIRTLMRLLRMEQLNDAERAELNVGLAHTGSTAVRVLDGFRQVGVISKNAWQHIHADISNVLKNAETEIEREEKLRHAFLSLLRIELETLDMLFKAGVIPQYTRLDIRSEIQTERDRLYAGEELNDLAMPQELPGIFIRLENMILKALREFDWLSPVLMHYQYMRISQHFQRDIARSMMVQSAITALQQDQTMPEDERRDLLEHLQRREALVRRSLTEMKRDMPEFYRHLSYRIASQASWFAALTESQMLYQHGQMGGKANAMLGRILAGKLDRLPAVSGSLPETTPSEVLKAVPLFTGLSEEIVGGLISRATTVTFLPGDKVIEEGEHGDSLYVILHGMVKVYHYVDEEEEEVALLEDGDFFGEMALLGEHVRSMSVSAIHACTLLRLRRDDVLALAEEYPKIDTRLREVEQARRDEDAAN